MPFGRRVKGADAHQAMHAGLGFQPTIGIVPSDFIRCGLNTGFFAYGL